MPPTQLHTRDKPENRSSTGKVVGKSEGAGELQIGRVLGKLLLTERLGAGAGVGEIVQRASQPQRRIRPGRVAFCSIRDCIRRLLPRGLRRKKRCD